MINYGFFFVMEVIFFGFFFFFQAEDGIRDADVTGVQTCALPLLKSSFWPRSVPWGADCCPTTARPSPVVRAALLATPELERDDRSTPISHGRRTTAAAAAPPDWKATSRRWPSTAGT